VSSEVDLDQIRDLMPFAAQLGIVLDSASAEEVRTDLVDDDQRPVAQITQSQAVRSRDLPVAHQRSRSA
jgi:hypothetical protein